MECIDFNLPIHNNADLPHYPNPGLSETLDRYLEWLEPLVDTDQMKQARSDVADFKVMPQFHALSDKMDQLAEGSEDSYIYNYWVKGHLGFRDPICPYTSVPILYGNPLLNDMSQAEQAAALLAALAEVYRVFRRDGNSSYHIGKKIYSNDELFGALASVNHIRRGLDQMYINEAVSHHSLIIHKNRIYRVEVLQEDGSPVPYGRILNAVRSVLNRKDPGLEVNFNLVTSEPDRDRAGDNMEALLAIPGNAEVYQQVKDAIAVVNLDTCSPEDTLQRLYCTCCDPLWFNRFHSKGVQFNVCSNGAKSMIVDHTYCDGGIEVYLVNRVGEVLSQLDMTQVACTAPLTELHFDLTGMENRLRQSFARYRRRMGDFEARYVRFPALNRTVLKEKGILSGDGFMHLAFQVAQKLTWDQVRNTYISVDCRKFFRGRTEVNRPVTHASKSFVDLLLSGTADQAALKASLAEALDAHHTRTQQAQSGLGVNRYLFAVKEVCKDYAQELGLTELPKFFNSEGFGIMGQDWLSTTAFGQENMEGCYFPPVIPHGIGIFYHIDECAYVMLCTFLDDDGLADRFDDNLALAIDKMLAI